MIFYCFILLKFQILLQMTKGIFMPNNIIKSLYSPNFVCKTTRKILWPNIIKFSYELLKVFDVIYSMSLFLYNFSKFIVIQKSCFKRLILSYVMKHWITFCSATLMLIIANANTMRAPALFYLNTRPTLCFCF